MRPLPQSRTSSPAASVAGGQGLAVGHEAVVERRVAVVTWGGARFRVVVYRTHVQHETAKNFQLDLFDPSDGHY